MRVVKCSVLTFALGALTIACAPRREARSSSSSVGPGEPAPGASIGRRAPAFERPELTTAERVRVPDGKVTVVMFFATWSLPDKIELSSLQELFIEHRDAGLAVIGVSIDDEEEGVRPFTKDLGVTFPVVWDGTERRVARAFQPAHEPTTYVLDRDGTVRHVHGGFHPGEDLAIDDEVSALLYPNRCSRPRAKTVGHLCMHHCARLATAGCVADGLACRLACERADTAQRRARHVPAPR